MALHSEDSGYKVKYHSAARVHKSDGSLQDIELRIEYEKYDPTHLTCMLAAHHLEPEDIISAGTSECHIIARNPVEHPIRIWGIHGWSTDRSEVVLNAFGVDIGCTDDLLPEGEDVSVTVRLSAGKVLRNMKTLIRSYDGTITHYEGTRTPKVDNEEREIKWEEQGVKTEARILYVYENTAIANNPALLQIACPSIGQWFKADGATSLKQIMDRTDEDARDIARLLALCSREHVGWYEIEVETVNFKDSPRLYPRAKRRGSLPNNRASSDRGDPLVDHRDLIDGGFKRLLDAYRSSKYREALKRAITFEVGSQNESGLETAYALCHMALEVLVNDLEERGSNAPTLDNGKWSKLQVELEGLVKTYGLQNAFDQSVLDTIIKRIPELTRVSLADAVKQQVDTWGVKVDDLWPSEIGFLAGLRQAIKLRNDLFHRASASDPDLLFENHARLKVLVERFILKVLGWPDEKIWVRHSQEVKWVNKASETKPPKSPQA